MNGNIEHCSTCSKHEMLKRIANNGNYSFCQRVTLTLNTRIFLLVRYVQILLCEIPPRRCLHTQNCIDRIFWVRNGVREWFIVQCLFLEFAKSPDHTKYWAISLEIWTNHNYGYEWYQFEWFWRIHETSTSRWTVLDFQTNFFFAVVNLILI